ncbi:alanine racemase [Actibacterium sp.]|uniref:alanine racemase n=1 Tax=Actibacterium sp. TaxID=1872125 RepID=UPI0035691EB5
MSTGSLNINLEALKRNWAALDARSASGVETGAVVKANGYGLGSAQVARALAQAGARKFFVATAEEGSAVREVLGRGPEIFVFGGHMSGDTDMINDLDLIPMLNSVDQLTRHFEALPGAAFGIQLDTGMNRLGMEMAEWAAVAEIALTAGPRLVMSHLACADEPDHPQNAQQLATFHAMTDGINVPRSLSATGGILLGPDYHFDVTRPGVGLYGGLPFEEAEPVVNLSLPVIQTREVEQGESVGYSATWIAEEDSVVATVSGGYADGLIRAMSGRGHLFFDGTPCPIVGRVSMDLITVDVTHLAATPRMLDILGPDQTIDDLADVAGTIGYEILTSLGARYKRRYVGDLV